MLIWIIDHYSVPVKYYPLARNTNFAKNFMKKGHEVVIFAASSVHNSDYNLIDDGSHFKEMIEDGVKYVLVKCHQYTGNGIRRIINMYEFSWKLEKICNHFPKPDVIVSTSMTLQACKKGIQLSHKYGCCNVAQITDLWPESLIAYGKVSSNHPIVKLFRRIEKWIYIHSDKLVFSMEGAYDYIKERGWQNAVPESKVRYINNGVDLEEFEYNRTHYLIEDEDLTSADTFKAVYTGSIRVVNNVGILVDAAKLIKNPKIKILIWGEGDQREELEKRCKNERITNIKFKGKVEKKYIPYIISNADLNLAHSSSTPLFRFGMSLNKMFDYAASGKPILVDFYGKYNPVIDMGAGVQVNEQTAEAIAVAIEHFSTLNAVEYNCYCNRSRQMAIKYSFSKLAEKMLEVMREANADKDD